MVPAECRLDDRPERGVTLPLAQLAAGALAGGYLHRGIAGAARAGLEISARCGMG